MQKLIYLILPLLAVQIRINILTTIVINQVPFIQNLSCPNCLQPVTYSIADLPSFAQFSNNQLKINGKPEPGQYHLSCSIVDGNGEKANLLLIIIILDDIPINSGMQQTSSRELIVNFRDSGENGNLTNQLLQSGALKNEEMQMQNILDNQAILNKKIANLLIMIRRYKNSKLSAERDAGQIAEDLENLIPSESAMTEEILINENKLSKDKLAIAELLLFIKKVRKQIIDKKQTELITQTIIKTLTQSLKKKLIEKSTLEVTLQLRTEFLQNLTKAAQSQEKCDYEGISSHNGLLMGYQKKQDSLKRIISENDEILGNKRRQIDGLRAQLSKALEQERQMQNNQSVYEIQLNSVLRDKNQSICILQVLKQQCRQANQTTEIEENIQKLNVLIIRTTQQISRVKEQIKELIERIESTTTTVNELTYDIDFLNRQIDQAIDDLQHLYAKTQEVQDRISYLMEQKYKITRTIERLEDQLQNVVEKGNTTNISLKQAKEQLAELLVKKKETDEQVQQIMLNNLDIIKSLKGKGQHKFDLTQIVNMTSSVVDFDISLLFEIKLSSEIGQCKSGIVYYGLGLIDGVQGGNIAIKGRNDETLPLNHLDCSISMSTRKNYEPQKGDVMCWKGYRDDGKWVILESIIFPAKKQ